MKQVDKFTARFPQTPLLEAENIPAISAALKRFGIPEEEVRLCQNEAFKLLREKKIQPNDIVFETIEGGSEEMVSFSIRLDAPLKTVMELDTELGERIFEVCPMPHLNNFWLGFERDHNA